MSTVMEPRDFAVLSDEVETEKMELLAMALDILSSWVREPMYPYDAIDPYETDYYNNI